MLDELHDESIHALSSPRILGVTPAIVIENVDFEAQGRMKVSFPWIPNIELWARMCAPVAGNGCGVWAVPQVGDEVLVAFAHGDVEQPYVLGGLWSMQARPPAAQPTDARTKRIVRSPLGHSITLDDVPPAITVEHNAGHKIEMTADGIKISTSGGAASIELTAAGEIKITGRTTVSVSAPAVKVAGDSSAQVTGGAVEVSATGPCKVAGSLVAIN
ncbi:MAG: hypothetical protein QOE44_2367 [Solirubrobacteraceae bacterium]|nr:hypothetical protein [Solirubrobacteraceae bacterium]